MKTGEMSFHDVILFHGSEPNRSAPTRVGFAIRYAPTYVRQLSPIRHSALLMRGHRPTKKNPLRRRASGPNNDRPVPGRIPSSGPRRGPPPF